MATGDVVKLGGFYLNGTLQARPTRPWYGTPTGASAAGNIPTFSAGQSIEIRDTPSADASKIQWVEVVQGAKKYLIADRVLLFSVSWDDLNAQGLISGKEITIDGQKYLVRVLKGGSTYRGSDGYSGGSPTNNEWDQFIVNELGLAGLPVPTGTDLDTTQNATDLNGAHNQKWNWYYAYSWCQETYSANSAARAIRGYLSARLWGHSNAALRYAHIGWRPVLEVLDSAPVISGSDTALGNKTAPFTTTYNVSEPDGQTFSVVEKLNGTTIGSVSNVSTLSNREITLTLEQWNNLALNVQHSLTIEATDEKGNKSTRTFTFTKTNAAPNAVPVEPKGDLANLAVVDTLTPVLVWSFTDADAGDVQSAYQVQVYDTNDNLVHDSGKKTGTQSYYTIPDSVLAWGTRYKWQVRVFDRFDVSSEYSFNEFFLPNRPPTATNLRPGSNDVNTPAGAGATPEFTWTFDDLDLEAQASYRLRIFKTADDALVYNSNRIYRNVQLHQLPAGALENGQSYYAILEVWDPNGLTAETPKAYFQTNATPSTPTMTLPIDNYRTSERPTFQAIIGSDPEGDNQHFVIQIAENPEFTVGVIEFASNVNRAGWQVAGFDIPEEGTPNSSQGQIVKYTTQVDLSKWKTMFWRIAAIDASTNARGAWSSARRIRVGNKLDYNTLAKPIVTDDVAARRILIALNYELAQDGAIPADMQVLVTNNAGDVTPTWEDATTQFMNQDYFVFANDTKTSSHFAVALRVLINANDTMEDIFIDGAGMTFD